MKSVADKEGLEILKTFDFLSTPAFIIDEELTILTCNTSAFSFFQYEAADIIGEKLGTFISFVDSLPAGETFQRTFPPSVATKSAAHFLSACRRKNGYVFTAKVSVIPYRDHRQDLRIAVVQDVSEQKKLQEKATQRTKELFIFKTFAEILTKHTSTDGLMRETVGMLIPVMDIDAGLIYLTDPDTGGLRLAVRTAARDFSGIPETVKPGESLVGKVLQSGKPLLVRKASEDPRVTLIRTGERGVESMAAVPLSSKGTILGVLAVASRRQSNFTSMDIQLLKTIGSQLGVAIENLKLIGQLQGQMRQIELINELSGIINASLSIGTIFRMMVSEIKKLIHYDRASLLLYNEKKDNLLIFALDTEMKTIMKKGVTAPIEGTSAGWVVRNNSPWISYDLKDTTFALDRKLLDEGIRSTISIPLYHDRMLGVFNFDCVEPSKYSEKDLQILLPIAKHISIALENALLFEEISREKKEWERTFDAFTDMVWIEDGSQQIIRANHALLAKTGFSKTEITSRHCCDLLDKLGVTISKCLCSETLTSKRPSFQEFKGTAGNMFHFWAYPLIDEEGRLYAIVHYLKDVTAQKRLEQQLIRSDKLASLGTLVAGIAHEINNPLGIIAGYSEALLDRAREQSLLNAKEFEDFPEYLTTIHSEIFRCKGILKSLLEFARPSGGTFREIDINEVIKEVLLLLQHRTARLKHTIELDLNRDVPKIFADAGSLRQLLMNILLNAIYFTPEGGSIFIRTAPDNAGEERESGRCPDFIRLTVTDTGTGIPGDQIDKIFDPFFTTKPVGEGTGLGLTICHKIVKEHGGTIDVESEVGKGSTFIIKLPAMECRE